MKDLDRRVILELRIGRQNRIYVEGSCYNETPGMHSKIFWYRRDGSVPEGSIDVKKLLGDATLLQKYSQLISFANNNFPGRDYRIKMNTKREVK